MPDSSFGMSLICGRDSQILEVIESSVCTTTPVQAGVTVEDLIVAGDKAKFELFLGTLLSTPCVLDWLITVDLSPEPQVMRFTGCQVAGQLLIVAADSYADTTGVLETFAAVNNELLTKVRILEQDRATGASLRGHTTLLENMSRVNSELSNLQRELARKNRELEAAKGSLALEVNERTQELANSLDDLARAMRAKDEFFAQMNHELRTPLNSIIGFSRVLLMGSAGTLSAEQERQIEMISKSGQRLLSLVNDILDLSRAEADKVELNIEVFQIRPLVESVLAEAEPLASSKGLMLRCFINDGLSDMCSDRFLLWRVLTNLVANSVKFTSKGQVSVEAVRLENHVEFRVRDTGPGVLESERDTIFMPFVQGTTGNSDRIPSTGLGLAISKELARRLDGDLRLALSDSSGSEFVLRIPLTPELTD